MLDLIRKLIELATYLPVREIHIWGREGEQRLEARENKANIRSSIKQSCTQKSPAATALLITFFFKT